MVSDTGNFLIYEGDFLRDEETDEGNKIVCYYPVILIKIQDVCIDNFLL